MNRFWGNNSAFFHNIITLIKGTASAQLISLAISPILSRLYTPEEFGIFALYVSIVSILAVVSTGRYELAIVPSKNKEEAQELLNLSILISFFVSLFLLIVLLFTGNRLVAMFNLQKLSFWIYFIPVSVFTLSIFNILTMYFTKLKKYKNLAISKIVLTSTIAVSNLSLFPVNLPSFGLITGQFLGQMTSVVYLMKNHKLTVGKSSKKSLLYVLKKYKNFPLKNGLSGLFNILSNQLPVVLIGSFFGNAVLGYYSLVMKVLNMPLSLIGRSYSQVYFQEISDIIANYPEKEFSFVKSNTLKLFAVALIPSVILFFTGEYLFSIIFGSQWAEAGKIASVFSLFYLVRFVYFSQSTYLIAKQALSLELMLNVLLFSLQVLSIYTGYLYFRSYMLTFWLMSICGIFSYGLFLTFVFFKSRR